MGIFKKAVDDLGITALYETRSLINSYICEDLGISDYVGTETDKLYSLVIANLKDVDWFPYEYKGKPIKEIKTALFTFEYNFNNANIVISFDTYNFKDNNVRNKWSELIPDKYFETAGSSYGNVRLPVSKTEVKCKTLYLHVLMVSGTVDKERLHGSIRHELRHIYEQMKNRHRNFAGRKDNNLYMRCSDAYNNGNENTADSNVGFLGYMTFDYERHAFVEEYFDRIKYYIEKSNQGDNEAAVRLSDYLNNNNEVMQIIVKMRYVLSKLQNKDKNYINAAIRILEGTGFSLDKFIKRADEAIHDLAMRYGKCIVKAKKDFAPLFDFNKYNTITYYENKDKPYAEWYI